MSPILKTVCNFPTSHFSTNQDQTEEQSVASSLSSKDSL